MPLAIFGVFVVIGLAYPDSNSSQPQTQNIKGQPGQVQGQTITIPTYQQPLEIKQEQPQNSQINTPQPEEQPSYYINSTGNKVQSPTKTQDNSVPVGATARCGDGSYSFSQHRSGTCSHHSGVATWLY